MNDHVRALIQPRSHLVWTIVCLGAIVGCYAIALSDGLSSPKQPFVWAGNALVTATILTWLMWQLRAQEARRKK